MDQSTDIQLQQISQNSRHQLMNNPKQQEFFNLRKQLLMSQWGQQEQQGFRNMIVSYQYKLAIKHIEIFGQMRSEKLIYNDQRDEKIKRLELALEEKDKKLVDLQVNITQLTDNFNLATQKLKKLQQQLAQLREGTYNSKVFEQFHFEAERLNIEINKRNRQIREFKQIIENQNFLILRLQKLPCQNQQNELLLFSNQKMKKVSKQSELILQIPSERSYQLHDELNNQQNISDLQNKTKSRLCSDRKANQDPIIHIIGEYNSIKQLIVQKINLRFIVFCKNSYLEQANNQQIYDQIIQIRTKQIDDLMSSKYFDLRRQLYLIKKDKKHQKYYGKILNSLLPQSMITDIIRYKMFTIESHRLLTMISCKKKINANNNSLESQIDYFRFLIVQQKKCLENNKIEPIVRSYINDQLILTVRKIYGEEITVSEIFEE